VPVEWNEINAAWGQTALLLSVLAKKVGMEFQKYILVNIKALKSLLLISQCRVGCRFANLTTYISKVKSNSQVPYGSYSYIKVISDGKALPLYGSGGFKMIFDTKFDMGMVAFLDCLQQFAAEVVQKQVPPHLQVL
jgi:beclin 1